MKEPKVKSSVIKKSNIGIPIMVDLDLDIIYTKEGKYWIAFCPALELSSYSDTKEKLFDSFDKTIDIYLEETLKKGTLEKDLLRLGWTLQKVPVARYEPPRIDLKKIFNNFHNPSVDQQRVSLPV